MHPYHSFGMKVCRTSEKRRLEFFFADGEPCSSHACPLEVDSPGDHPTKVIAVKTMTFSETTVFEHPFLTLSCLLWLAHSDSVIPNAPGDAQKSSLVDRVNTKSFAWPVLPTVERLVSIPWTFCSWRSWLFTASPPVMHDCLMFCLIHPVIHDRDSTSGYETSRHDKGDRWWSGRHCGNTFGRGSWGENGPVNPVTISDDGGLQPGLSGFTISCLIHRTVCL